MNSLVATDQPPIISVSSFTKSYGTKRVFEDVNVVIPNGINGFIGLNGYGKTTFLETCMGIRSEYSGEITILGYNIRRIKNIKNLIGYVPDKISLPQNIIVKEYIDLVAGLYDTEVPKDLIANSGLESVINKKIGTLSAGYLKRLSFILAVLHKPKLVLADEIFANVDVDAANAMKTIIKKLSKNGTSFVITSNDIFTLSESVDHMFIISDRKIKNIIHTKLHGPILEIQTTHPEELYSYVKEKFLCEIHGNSVLIEYDDIKSALNTVLKFSGDITKLKTLDGSEVIANESLKALNEDRN